MARIKGPRKVHRYSAEFKLKAVKLSDLGGVQVKDVAEALDIHPFMLSCGASGHGLHRIQSRVDRVGRGISHRILLFAASIITP
jgi:hypothetical protein